MAYLPKVYPGQPLQISADTFNCLIDAGNEYQSKRQGIGRGRISTPSASIILIKNASGASKSKYNVLGISGVIVNPATNLESFLQQIIFTGITPDVNDHAGGKFVILAEPVGNNEIARAWTFGVCRIKVNVVTANDTKADIVDGDATKLQSGGTGPCTILWKEAGTGEKWAIVRFGAAGGAGVTWATITQSLAYGTPGTLVYKGTIEGVTNCEIKLSGTEALQTGSSPSYSQIDPREWIPWFCVDDVVAVAKNASDEWVFVQKLMYVGELGTGSLSWNAAGKRAMAVAKGAV